MCLYANLKYFTGIRLWLLVHANIFDFVNFLSLVLLQEVVEFGTDDVNEGK